jgi:hypothetical protein
VPFTFRLTLKDGDDGGDFTTAVSDWKIGETFQTDSGFRYRLIDYLPVPEESVYDGLWMVEQVEPV